MSIKSMELWTYITLGVPQGLIGKDHIEMHLHGSSACTKGLSKGSIGWS